MRITHLEKCTCGRAGLLKKVFDKFVDDLRDDHTKGEEDDMEVAAEEEMRGETAEGYKDGHQRHPR